MKEGKYEFGVVTEVYRVGEDEYGVDYVADCFYVGAQDEFGNRLMHNRTFLGCEVHHDEEGGGNLYVDVRDAAFKRAEAFLTTIQAKGVIDRHYWVVGAPVYGSLAYIN